MRSAKKFLHNLLRRLPIFAVLTIIGVMLLRIGNSPQATSITPVVLITLGILIAVGIIILVSCIPGVEAGGEEESKHEPVK